MADEPAQNEAPAPTAMDEEHDQQQNHQQLPALPLDEAAVAAKAPVERNEELEIAIQGALEGPGRDLGRLCKTLGEHFCLAPPRPKAVRAVGYDSAGSDTTSPADQEHSGGSSSSSGSETGRDHAAVSGGAPRGTSSGKNNKADAERDETLQAVAAAARVRKSCCACRLARCRVFVSEPEWGKRETWLG